MNLILKIIQGPNAGAEIALIEGVNVKLGRSDECDIVLADQTLPDVACEIEVGSDRVMLLLPGGGQEHLEPLHVKLFETTAIAVGPADAPWGALVWPDKETDVPVVEETINESKEEKSRFRKLQWSVLIVLILVVILEFALWFFWPYLNGHVVKLRAYCHAKYEAWTADKMEQAAQPVRRQTLEELAKAYQVDCVLPPQDSEEKTILKGNLKTRSDRLKLTATAYAIQPGCVLELTDDESLKRAAEELLNMLTEGNLKLDSAENRQMALSGHLKSVEELHRILTAIKTDIPHVEKIDCSKVEIAPPPVVEASPHLPVQPVPKSTIGTEPEKPEKTEEKEPEVAQAVQAVQAPPVAEEKSPSLPNLPVVGVLTVPYPCLVLRNGSRVIEGAEFNGYIVSKISEEVILLKNGDTTLEWRP